MICFTSSGVEFVLDGVAPTVVVVGTVVAGPTVVGGAGVVAPAGKQIDEPG
jgi:hypothetical protein